MLTRRHFVQSLLMAATSLPTLALAKDFPAKPIKLIVPTAPGGNLDLMARGMGPGLGETLGQPWIIENRGGANGMIGKAAVARSSADGYTLLMTDSGFLIPSLEAPMQFDPVRDFTPISVVCETSFFLVAGTAFHASSFADFVAAAKARPGTITYSTPGVGSINHICMEQFAAHAGIKLLHVPYSGGGPATLALISNQVDISFAGVSSLLPHVAAGAMKALACSGTARHVQQPNIPTFSELGMAGFAPMAWYGILGPRSMPQPVVHVLSKAIWDMVSSVEFREQTLVPRGFEPKVSIRPEDFASRLHADQKNFNGVLQGLGLKTSNG